MVDSFSMGSGILSSSFCQTNEILFGASREHREGEHWDDWASGRRWNLTATNSSDGRGAILFPLLRPSEPGGSSRIEQGCVPLTSPPVPTVLHERWNGHGRLSWGIYWILQYVIRFSWCLSIGSYRAGVWIGFFKALVNFVATIFLFFYGWVLQNIRIETGVCMGWVCKFRLILVSLPYWRGTYWELMCQWMVSQYY